MPAFCDEDGIATASCQSPMKNGPAVCLLRLPPFPRNPILIRLLSSRPTPDPTA